MALYFLADRMCGKHKRGECPIGKAEPCEKRYAVEITAETLARYPALRAPGPFSEPLRFAYVKSTSHEAISRMSEKELECGAPSLVL